MTTEFWIGIILSIPLGILTGLATPWFQKLFDKWNQSKLLKTKHNAKLEYEKVKLFYDNKQEMTHYFLSVAIKTTFIGAFVGIFSGIIFTSAQLTNTTFLRNNEVFINILYALGQFVSLIGSLLIVNICRPAMNIWTKVKNFSEYENVLKQRQIIENANT